MALWVKPYSSDPICSNTLIVSGSTKQLHDISREEDGGITSKGWQSRSSVSLHRNAEAVTLAFSLGPVYPQDVLHTPPASFIWAWKTTGTTRPFSSPLSCRQQSSLLRPFDPRVHRIKFSLYETVLTVEVQTHHRPPDAQTSLLPVSSLGKFRLPGFGFLPCHLSSSPEATW